MSAAKGRRQEGTFHIQSPARKDFWTWTELGCLGRALGFPTDLIRHNVTEEVETEEGGVTMQQLHRMIELKLLNQALHRSFNMHTSDWNLCVIRKAARLLSISVLSFEELHNIRVAYATYEAGDMKGLLLDQRILLRTLKMCQRVISPKKLMHRVKHMKSRLEEANRIQLYEFFDLILWCDYMEHCEESHGVGEAEGKERDLYNLVDFETLLSHQDQRRSRALDERYLAEEWDFGREQLGSKHMFKGEVVYTDQRLKQTRTQKNNYRGLKRAVSHSQRQVYRAHAGSIRQRPISAPDLSRYSTPRGTPCVRTTSASAVYQSVQRRLHSASSPRANSGMDRSDRPSLPEYVRAHTPSVVTSQDLDEASLKMEMLKFDIVTLGTRCEVKMQEERNFYIPEYEPPVKEVSGRPDKEEGKKAEHWTSDIIDSLAYPPYHLSRHHAHTCDARFRGWKPAEHQGRQRILTTPTYDSSPKGQLLARQRSALLAPVTNLHRDYVVRYTSRREATEQQKARRPCTAPMTSPRSKPLKRLGCRSAGHCSRRQEESMTTTTSTGTETAGDIGDENLHQTVECGNNEDQSAQTTTTMMAVNTYPDPYGKYCEQEERVRNWVSLEEKHGGQTVDSGYEGTCPADAALVGLDPLAAAACGRFDPSADPSTSLCRAGEGSNSGTGGKEERSLPSTSSKNGPSRHPPGVVGGSKVVDMGLIGTVTLLESIQEQEAEDTSTKPSRGLGAEMEEKEEDQDVLRIRGGVNPAAAASRGHQASKSGPHPAGFEVNDGAAGCCAGVVGVQKPKERSLHADAISSPSGRHERKRLYHDDFQSSRVKGEPPLRAEAAVAAAVAVVAAEQRGDAEMRRPPRVSSAASSSVSERSDHREVPPPLTSVNVTVKSRNCHVTSVTRVNSDAEAPADVTEGGSVPIPSPQGFKRSSPCVTSTPRRKRTSPNSPTKGRQAGHGNPSARKSSQAKSYHTNPPPPPPAPPQLTRDPAKRPDSSATIGGKGLGRQSLRLLPSETDPDGRLDWVQDQILAQTEQVELYPHK